MDEAVFALHRRGADDFELNSLTSRSRWRITTTAAEAVIRDPLGFASRTGIASAVTPAAGQRRVLDVGHENGLGVGAWYAAATYDYPFLDYASDGYEQDNARMKRYAVQDRQVDEVASGASGPILEDPDISPKVATLMRTVFGAIFRGHARWSGEVLYRRTSPSGGSRHPTNGYLLVPGQTFAWYYDPLDNQFHRSDIRVDETFAEYGVLLTLAPVRNRSRYREPRTFRTIFMDVGHIGRTLTQAARELGLLVTPDEVFLGAKEGQSRASLLTGSLDELAVVSFRILDPEKGQSVGGNASPAVKQPSSAAETVRPRTPTRLLVDANFGRTLVHRGAGLEKWHQEPRDALEVLRSLRPLGSEQAWIDAGWGLALDAVSQPGPLMSFPGLAFGEADCSIETMFGRTTHRKFSDAALSEAGLVRICAAAAALERRLAIGVVVYNVEGLEPGVYRVRGGRLSKMYATDPGELRVEASRALQGQSAPLSAAATVCTLANFGEYTSESAGPSVLYQAWIESGAVIQSCVLRAEALGCRGLPTPATTDSAFDALFELPVGEQQATHTFTFGFPV